MGKSNGGKTQENMTVGKRAERLLKDSGLTLEEFSEKSGMPVSSVSRVSQGIVDNPTPKNLRKLAKAFGITVEQLKGDIPYTKPKKKRKRGKVLAEKAKKGELTLKEFIERGDRAGQMRKPMGDIVSDLRQSFMRDFTVEQACNYVGITVDTFYRWLKESEGFAKEIQSCRDYLFRKAREVLAEAITNKKSTKEAKWLLSRRERNLYALRTEQTGKDGEGIEVNVTNYRDADLKNLSSKELKKLLRDQLREEQKE